MLLIFVLVSIVIIALGVVVLLLRAIKKEEAAAVERSVVPITDLGAYERRATSRVEDSNVPGKASDVAAETVVFSAITDMPYPSATVGVVSSLPSPVAGVGGSPDYEGQIRQLKEEVRLIREKAVVQARNAIEVITKLREANERFSVEQDQRAKEAANSSFDRAAFEHLKAENAALLEKFETVSRKAARASADVDQLRGDLAREQARAQEACAGLEELAARRDRSLAEDRERIVGEIQAQYCGHIDALRAEIEMLRARLESDSSVVDDAALIDSPASSQKAAEILREEMGALEARIRELESVNAILMDKNNFLQYELTKSLAQSVGFERVYDNSLRQVDELTRQISSSMADNRELKRQSDVLERNLLDFKRLNNELLKREKLSQFEIEKRRGDVEDLERIYNGLRFRVNQAGLDAENVLGDRRP